MLNMILKHAVRAAIVDDAEAVGGAEIAALADTAEVEETAEQATERKARLMAQEAQAKATAGDGTQVPENVLELARKEIMVCWEEYAGQGGVYELQKQAKGKLRNIAQHILRIAKECAAAAYERNAGKPDEDWNKLASSMFRNAMAMAELTLRGSIDLSQPEMEEKLDSFIAGSWSIYRGQIRSSIEAGFDPRDFDSIYGLKKAVEQSKLQRSTGTRTDEPKDDDQGTADTQTNEEAVSNAATEAAKETTSGTDDDKDGDSVGLDWSQLEAITRKNGKVQSALILLHKAIYGCDLDADNNEERVINSLNLAARQINQLSRHEVQEEMAELEDDIGERAAGEEESPMARAVRSRLEASDESVHAAEPEAVEA